MRVLRRRGRPAAAGARVSVVVPVLDESCAIEATLDALLAARPDEVVVADGGSSDGTPERVRGLEGRFAAAGIPLRLVSSPRGRARQMNAGARAASGDALLFLHADTRLPRGGIACVREALAAGCAGGWFALALDSAHPLSRPTAWLATLRSRWFRVATGDMGIFAGRAAFFSLGGFPEVPLMEDVLFSRRLARAGRVALIQDRVTTSARRWERSGWVRTVLRMWTLRALHSLGARPERLRGHYPDVR